MPDKSDTSSNSSTGTDAAQSSGGDGINGNHSCDGNPENDKSSASTSGSQAFFGSMPLHIFRTIRNASDDAIIETASALPLLPNTKSHRFRSSTRRLSKRPRPTGGLDGDTTTRNDGDKNEDNLQDAEDSGSEEGEAGAEVLRLRMQMAYDVNFDKCEAFAMRNVFSTPRYWRSRLIAVAAESDTKDCLTEVGSTRDETCQKKEETEKHEMKDSDSSDKSRENETKENIPPQKYVPAVTPSVDQSTQLDSELWQLQQRLHQARKKKQLLQTQLCEVQEARSSMEGTFQTIAKALAEQECSSQSPSSAQDFSHPNGANSLAREVNKSPEAIAGKMHDAVIAAMMGKDGLEEARSRGIALLGKLDDVIAKEEEAKGGDSKRKNTAAKKATDSSMEERFATLKKRMHVMDDETFFWRGKHD